MRILVIDDEVAVADLLADAVRSEGHDTTVAHDGEAGLALLSRERPDAVFLDVAMPGMDGIEVLRRIRAGDSSLPVVLITGRADAEELDEARRLGVSEVIYKPDILTHLTAAFTTLRAQGSG